MIADRDINIQGSCKKTTRALDGNVSASYGLYDEVHTLASQTRPGREEHFQWDTHISAKLGSRWRHSLCNVIFFSSSDNVLAPKCYRRMTLHEATDLTKNTSWIFLTFCLMLEQWWTEFTLLLKWLMASARPHRCSIQRHRVPPP